MTDNRLRSWYAPFASTIFLSSFLLFQVQPLIGKYILPWFGGAPGVWSTCMLFFQVVLFAGYAYAHFLIKYIAPRWQILIHAVALAAALCLLPIAPTPDWKPVGTEDPTWRILGLLASTIGLPYFLLSANGPLLQAWFNRVQPDTSPYGLYSLSNVGSLLGLVSYPFLVEPQLSVDAQTRFWSWGFVAFSIFCLVCALMMARAGNRSSRMAIEKDVRQPEDDSHYGLWFALPACGSIMLLAITNQVCLDVAAIPFLWVIPLMLYLLTFILAFANPVWYPRRLYMIAFAIAIVSLCSVLYSGPKTDLATQIGVYFTALFICCMVCHGEMVLLKPHPSRLTSFYLFTSAGGAAGGAFVALIAPLLFNKFIELHIGIFACGLLIALTLFFGKHKILSNSPAARPAGAAVFIALLALAFALSYLANKNSAGELISVRNFYGVLRVREDPAIHPTKRMLFHGQILHGAQFIENDLRLVPTTYYGEHTGVGLAMNGTPGSRRVGIVGLGTGTIALFGRPGDLFRFYDINPDVVRLAGEYFTYLDDSQARIEHVLGDARLALDREAPQQFDILVVDAFSSDAIPTHLLTAEAFEIYLKHLREGGLLVVHISNRHFDLKPVIRGAANQFQLWLSIVHTKGAEELDQNTAIWTIMARGEEPFRELGLSEKQLPQAPGSDAAAILWTDNFTNLFRTLK